MAAAKRLTDEAAAEHLQAWRCRPFSHASRDSSPSRGRMEPCTWTTDRHLTCKRLKPRSATGSIWHSFTDDNIAELTSGAYAIDLTDVNTHRTYGEIGGAVNIFEMGSRWSAFAKGDFRFATDYTAGSGKIGFRYNW